MEARGWVVFSRFLRRPVSVDVSEAEPGRRGEAGEKSAGFLALSPLTLGPGSPVPALVCVVLREPLRLCSKAQSSDSHCCLYMFFYTHWI